VKVCQLPIQLARRIQSASPFPPAIFANVGLMFVVCGVYLSLSRTLPRGIAVDVARKRMEMRTGAAGPIAVNPIVQIVPRSSGRQRLVAAVVPDGGLIRSQEHRVPFARC
jgi:hypothetical protein